MPLKINQMAKILKHSGWVGEFVDYTVNTNLTHGDTIMATFIRRSSLQGATEDRSNGW